jgi:uncharacterized membrane protein YhaH (DUF805 family)
MSDATIDPVPLDQPSPRATPPQAVRRFFLKYAVFTGRASRAEYWWSVLFFFLVYAALWIIAFVLVLALTAVGQTAQAIAGLTVVGVGVLIALACIVPSIAISVRRLHDGNFSGFLYLLHLIPYVGTLIVLVLTILPSNPYGARFDEASAGYAPYPGQPGQPGYPGYPAPSGYSAPQPGYGAQPPMAGDVPPTPPTPPTTDVPPTPPTPPTPPPPGA